MQSNKIETKKLDVKCWCGGTGYIPQVSSAGDDTEFIECAKHHPAYQDPRNLK